MARVRVIPDMPRIRAKIKKASDKAREVISIEFLKDANYYARKDTGRLIADSIVSSDTKAGDIIWAVVYARKMFYVGTPRTDKNPHARLQWAEVAKVENIKRYQEIGQKVFRGAL